VETPPTIERSIPRSERYHDTMKGVKLTITHWFKEED